LYKMAKRRRPRSQVFNCACVPFDYQKEYIEITYLDLMSMVKGAMKDSVLEQKHYAIGRSILKDSRNDVPHVLQVPARTLTAVLDDADVRHIDFLSLDVEGFELDVLKGLDFDRYKPEYMLIEARFREDIDAYILDRYEVLEEISQMDVLYRLKVVK
jgi:FkbM family methyltransferase